MSNKMRSIASVTLSKVTEEAKRVEIWVTRNHKGKMEGIESVSTSVKGNPICQKRQNVEGSICQKCYAETLCKMRTTLDKHLEENLEIMSTQIVRDEDLPTIDTKYGRGESFGDSVNWMSFANQFGIARHNPDVRYAIWTKNTHHAKEAIDRGFTKPDNCIIVKSSMFMNKVDEIKDWEKPFVDKVFTVYDFEGIINGNVSINCGGKKCVECGLCYEDNDVIYINECLKSQLKKYERYMKEQKGDM